MLTLTLLALAQVVILRPAQPTRSPAGWVNADDYPPELIKRNVQGTVGFTLAVNDEGHVDSCVVTQSSGSLELDNRTCELLLRRARFFPAVDVGKRVVASQFISSVKWAVPVDAPVASTRPFSWARIEANTQERRLKIDINGDVVECSSSLPADGYCDNMRGRTDFKPFLDAKGAPVRKIVVMKSSTQLLDY